MLENYSKDVYNTNSIWWQKEAIKRRALYNYTANAWKMKWFELQKKWQLQNNDFQSICVVLPVRPNKVHLSQMHKYTIKSKRENNSNNVDVNKVHSVAYAEEIAFQNTYEMLCGRKFK